MKNIFYIILLCLFLIRLTYAENLASSDEKSSKAIENLLIGLNSDNYGLITSSAFMLGELKAEEAVIPLMKMLREDNNEKGRIVAALALYKIGTPLAINAVKQAVKFDESERVKKMCNNFYTEFYKEAFVDTSQMALK